MKILRAIRNLFVKKCDVCGRHDQTLNWAWIQSEGIVWYCAGRESCRIGTMNMVTNAE